LPTDAATNPDAAQYTSALDRLSKSLNQRNDTNWFSIAGALLDPGKTGSFGEAAGRAATVVGQQRQAELERQPAIVQMQMQIEGQKYELQSRADAMRMLGEAIGAPPSQVAQVLKNGSEGTAAATATASTPGLAETANKLQQIDPKVYLKIAAKNPTIGALVKDYAGMTDAQIKTQIEQDKLSEQQNQNKIGNQIEGVKLQNAYLELQIKVLQAGNDQEAKRRANAEFIDKVGPTAAKAYGIEIQQPAAMPSPQAPAIPGVTAPAGGTGAARPLVTPPTPPAGPQGTLVTPPAGSQPPPAPAMPQGGPAMPQGGPAMPQGGPAMPAPPMGPAAMSRPAALGPAPVATPTGSPAALIGNLTATRDKLSTLLDAAVKSGNQQVQAAISPQLADVENLLRQVGGQIPQQAQQAPRVSALQVPMQPVTQPAASVPQNMSDVRSDSPAVQRAIEQKRAEAQIGMETRNAETQLKPFNDKVAALNRFNPTTNSQAINNMTTLRQITTDPDGQAVFGQLQARDVDTVIKRAAKAAGQMVNTGVGIGHFGHANVNVEDLVSNLNLDDRQKKLASRALNAIAEETVANLSLNREAIGGRLSNYEDKQLSAAIANIGNLPEAMYYWAGKRLLQHQNDSKIAGMYSAWDEANPGLAVKNPRAFFKTDAYIKQNSDYLDALKGLDQVLLKK